MEKLGNELRAAWDRRKRQPHPGPLLSISIKFVIMTLSVAIDFVVSKLGVIMSMINLACTTPHPGFLRKPSNY